MKVNYIILNLILIFSGLCAQTIDSLETDGDEYPYFLDKLVRRNSVSDSDKSKIKILNSLRHYYEKKLKEYNGVKEIADSDKVKKIAQIRQVITDSAFGVIGLSADSLKSFRNMFEQSEKTINHYMQHSHEELVKSHDDLIGYIENSIFVFLPEFYDRCYLLEKKSAEIQIDVYIPKGNK